MPAVEPRFVCVLESDCDESALPRCLAAAPDLVVFDLAGRGSLELMTLGEFSSRTAPWALLVIGGGAPPQTVCGLISQKPFGFFSRNNSLEALARAGFLVATGGTYFDAPLHAQFFPGAASARSVSLSQRERHVLQLIGEGYSTKEVAAILQLSRKTVEKYRTSLMQKLDVHDVVKLTHCAIRLGYVTVS